MTAYEHQAVDHDASISAERPDPDQVTVTITRGEDEPASITMWAEDFETMAAEVRGPVSAPTTRCTCHPVPEHLHTTHYGATEPGSTLEPDYDCPVHFAEPECPCAACDPGYDVGFGFRLATRMSVCPDCDNKRCPKAANHARWECSGSNETGQVGVPVEPTAPTWLEQVRADVTAATTPLTQPMDGVIRQQAVERLLGMHVPGMVAALDAVEESIREWERNPMVGASSEEQWAMDTERAVARTLREDIETARSGV